VSSRRCLARRDLARAAHAGVCAASFWCIRGIAVSHGKRASQTPSSSPGPNRKVTAIVT
jgi:hypothetical protein